MVGTACSGRNLKPRKEERPRGFASHKSFANRKLPWTDRSEPVYSYHVAPSFPSDLRFSAIWECLSQPCLFLGRMPTNTCHRSTGGYWHFGKREDSCWI